MGSQMWKIILGNGINKITDKIFPNTFDLGIINEYNKNNQNKITLKDDSHKGILKSISSKSWNISRPSIRPSV